MLATAFRVGIECAGCVLAGTAAVELAPYFWDPQTDDKIEAKQAPLVSQSKSLSAEFTSVLHKIETASLAKLETAAGCTVKDGRGRPRGPVAQADVDELCANLCGGDIDMNEFPVVFADNEEDVGGAGRSSVVINKYRLVPEDEIAKLATSPPTSSIFATSRARPLAAEVLAVLAERDRYACLPGNASCVWRVTQIQAHQPSLPLWRDRYAADLLDNFELQQQRVARQLEYAAAACIEPRY